MPALFAFLASSSFVLSILALTNLLEPMPGAPWSDLQTVALVVAVGLVVKFAAVDGRIAAFPRRLALLQFTFALVPAAVVRLSTAGPYAGSGLDGIALRGMLLAPLAFTYGQSARRIVLHAGVPKLARMPQCGALVAGVALGAAAWQFGLAHEVGIWTIAFAAPCLVLARFAMAPLDRADMPEPEPFDGGPRVAPSLVGGLLLAYAITALVRLESGLGGEADATHAIGTAALGLAALVAPFVAGNARRSGLVLGGAALFLLFEWDRELARLGIVDRVANALLMSITPRTAGFNSVNYDGITNASLFLTFVLMWVGGGPASTAGGAKITTATLLALVLWARLRGEGHVSVAGRTVPDETVNRATGLAVGMVLILAAFLTLMVAFEPPAAQEERSQLVRLAFEVQSALSTVGLSMNLTPTLADGSKLTLVAVMLLGRVGPLAVLGAMTARSQRTSFRFAHEEVLIG